MENYIAYVRTSTGRQVLGLEEQQLRINQFIQSTGENLVELVIEQESGKNNNRIKYLNTFIYSLLIGNTLNQKMTHNDFKPIIERLRSKDGIIRHNILGRRIHGMGRAVITCDITVPYDTIKIPIEFAKIMQIKETVNDFNKELLMQYVNSNPNQKL